MPLESGPMEDLKIDLGCGSAKREGTIGIDRQDSPGVDIIHDINADGIPLPDNSCAFISSNHFMEHIERQHFVLTEIWRVGKPGAEIWMRVPYARSEGGPCDPVHVAAVCEYWFRRCYWVRQHLDMWMTFEYDELLLEWARKGIPGASDDILRALFCNVCQHMTIHAYVRKPALTREEAMKIVEAEIWWAQGGRDDAALRA